MTTRVTLLLILVTLLGCNRSTPSVGVLLPMSGAFQEWGREAEAGLLMAWEELDPENRVALEIVDTMSDEAEIPRLVEELVVDRGATVLVGPLTTGLALIAGATASSYEVPLVTPSATGEDVTTDNDWVFRLCYTDPEVAEALASFARFDLKLQRLAVVVDLANAYSVGLADRFSREFVRARGRIVAEVAHYDDPEELAEVLDRVAALDVDGALVAEYHDNLVAMLRGSTDPRLADLILLGSDGWEGPDVSGAMAGRVKGAYYTSHFCPDEGEVPTERQAQVASFLDRYEERYGGAPPTDFVALGYDAGRAILSVFDPSLDGPEMAERLRTLQHGGITGRIELDAQGSPVGKTMVFEQLHRTDGASRFVKRSR
jgi:branched-chain amino acid transport system substrate-binding protein